MASSYAPLHLRSNYSLLTGTAGVEEIVERAGTLGFHAVALTDVNNLYGAVDFYKTARASGIKPILGTQIVHGAASAVLLARNLVGYSNLCRIITRRNLDEKFSLQDALGEFEDGLFILTEDMRLAEALAQKVDPKYLWLEAAVQGRCRTQLQDIHKCAKELGVGVVATGDTYFLNQDDHLLHRVLLAVRENCMVSQVSRVAHPDSYLASGEEMRERFRDFPRALSNTLKIADACNLDLPMGKPIFPKYPLPAGETAHGALHKKCAAGLTWRYSPVSREAVERLTHELSLINTLGFSEYFLIVGDIVDFARGRGIPVVGRGSGAGSIVAYLLGITSVDPLKFNLPFERFLNPGRTDLPDLDIDFCWRLRDDVIDYVYETYGADHVAMISTHNLFRRRSAFREIAKSFGISNDMISRMGRRLAKVDNTGGHHEASLSDVPVSDETIKTIVAFADRIVGFPHHLSIHCGGIVISPETIDTYVPLEAATKGIAVTQYEMRAIEDIGLVKIDLLGNRGLSAVRGAVEILKNRSGIELKPEEFPDGDADTMKLIQRGQTIGCCQLESPAMRHLLLMLRPESVRGVIQALALIRPAPASIGMKEAFVRRARGLEPAQFPHPSVKDVLGDTYGIMLYEDDAMLVASTLAGLSLEEGDRLRKAIKKSSTKEKLIEVSRYFLTKAAENGIARDVAQDVWTQMAKFTEYSFCRAHAAGYGLVAYQAAYLKAHHPADYMVAALNNLQGIYPTRVHLWEAKRMGIEVLPPCVNHSESEFALEQGRIRIGLSYIKGLATRTIEAILKQREKEPFRALRGFLSRVSISLAELENLIVVGGFDFMGLPRPQLIWLARAMIGKIKSARGSDGMLCGVPDGIPMPSLEDYSIAQKVNYELQVLECPVSAHPVALARSSCGNDITRGVDLPQFVGKRVRLLGIIDTMRSTPTRNGETMEFLTMEDETGIFEVTLFPRTYRRFRSILGDYGPYLVEGTAQSQYGSLSVTAKTIARFRAKQ